jgi:hypothetical protein
VTVPPLPLHHRRAEAVTVAILLLPLVLAAPALIAGWAWSLAANLYTSEEAAFWTPQGAWSARPVTFRPRLPAPATTFEWVPTPPATFRWS